MKARPSCVQQTLYCVIAVARCFIDGRPGLRQHMPCHVQALCNYLAPHGVGRVASGGNPPRFYLHAEPSTGSGLRVLLELVVNPAAAIANVTIKSQDAGFAGPFEQLLMPLLQQFS